MIKNYFKIAWVNLFRNKLFSLVNILGLSIGMTSAIFIFLWVQDELAFDKDQNNYETIYQVYGNRNFNNSIYTDPNIAFPLANALENGYPQIKHAVVTSSGDSHVFSYNDKKLKRNGLDVSEHFFDIFNWEFIKGNAKTAFSDRSNVVLTENTAKAFFGNENPIGKILKVDGSFPAKVSAVIANPKSNSSFNFEYVSPYNYEFEKEAMKEWRNSFSCVYINAASGTDVTTLNRIVNEVMTKHAPEDKISTYFTHAMKDWHLRSDFKDGMVIGGMIEYVRLFSIVAIIIIVIACINFMNLSTARSEKKAKEVGVRKTLGSSRKQLIVQFLCESVLLTVIAFLFSILFVVLLFPQFNSIVNKQLQPDISHPAIWMVAFIIIVFTGFVSGSYPALYLSSFNPAKVLKGNNVTGKRALLPRRILVTSQFVISILLISSTIIVYKQIQHVKNRATGYASQNLIITPSSPDLRRNYDAVKQELLNSGAIEAVTRTSSPLTESWWSTGAPDWPGRGKNVDILFNGMRTDADFVSTIDLKILQGHYFQNTPSDSSAIVFNKTAIETMGLKDPIGMEMTYGPHKYTLIGVVDDIVMESPYKPVIPLMILFDKNVDCLHMRLNKNIPISEAIKKVETTINKYNPVYPFEFEFVDEDFNKKFITEELIGKLTNIFAGLAIFICCIGLAGLTAYTIEKRTREIGIRKVLGASLLQLVSLISNEFIKLVFVAFVITIPITWLLMTKWLQNFDFKVSISVWIFIVVGIVILALTLLIVFLNTLKTANSNPTKNLRTE